MAIRSLEWYLERFSDELAHEKFHAALNRQRHREEASDVKFSDEGVSLGQVVKCMGCGGFFRRIQVTHLRNKCSIKFDSIDAYLQVFPGAEIVPREVSKKTAVTKDNLLKKYGSDVGSQKFKDYQNAQAYSNSLEYKTKKHGWTEQQFNEFNKSRAMTKQLCIQRYGMDAGVAMWNSYIQRQKYAGCALEYFQELYGEEAGLIKFKEINSKKAISRQNFIRIHGEEIGSIMWDKFKNSRTGHSEFANNVISELVDLLQILPSDFLSFENNGELCLETIDGTPYLFDFTILPLRKIIEINGDYWHANPNKYDSSFVNATSKKTAPEIWAKDEVKRTLAEEHGFKVFTIWEYDWKHNKERVIDEVSEWIMI